MTYDWKAILALIGVVAGATAIGRFLVFRIPALQRMRELNQKADETKLADPQFREAARVTMRTANLTNLIFFAGILPFAVNLEPRPLWRHALDLAAVLLVFDLFYYLTHRFLYHSPFLGKVHAIHHEAQEPTCVDALYTHPLETAIGTALFLATPPLIAWMGGAPLHVGSVAIAILLFTHLNVINHAYVNLPYSPFKPLTYVTGIHAAHHRVDSRGNFALVSVLYDWMFGTLEPPVIRPAP